jgi:hypothetical protein
MFIIDSFNIRLKDGKVKRPSFTRLALLIIPLISSCAVEQSKFDVHLSARSVTAMTALSAGEIKEVIAFYEAAAREAEKNAAGSWFPQQYWVAATVAYSQASIAARFSGRLEISIAHGEKAVDCAEKIKGFVWLCPTCADQLPGLRILALVSLANAYKSVRSFAKARVLMENALEI